MGGKTGTVQVRRITKAEREKGLPKAKDVPWKDRDHAVFVGYAPVHAPRYAMAVLVEHGGGGSTVAAPIARDILLEHRPADTPVVIARNLGRADEAVRTVVLPALTPDDADMLTILIVGSSQTRRFTAGTRDWVYTPRGYAAKRGGGR